MHPEIKYNVIETIEIKTALSYASIVVFGYDIISLISMQDNIVRKPRLNKY